MFTDILAAVAAFWPALACGTLLCLTTAATSLAVRHHSSMRADDGGDQLFWDLFAGAAVAVPAIVVPSLVSPMAGLAVALAGVGAGAWAFHAYPRLVALQNQRRKRAAALKGLGAAVERHQRTMARWRRYELDPALAIDFPAMTDVRKPETAGLIRAIRKVEALNPADEPENYSQAVEALEHALSQAEEAAGSRRNTWTA